MSAPEHGGQFADAARDALAFVLAVQREDVTGIAAIFNNADPFDLAVSIASNFIHAMETMAVTGAGAPSFRNHREAQRWAAKEVRKFLETVQRYRLEEAS